MFLKKQIEDYYSQYADEDLEEVNEWKYADLSMKRAGLILSLKKSLFYETFK